MKKIVHKKIIKSKSSYNWILLIGGIFSTFIGVFIFINFNEIDNDGVPNWFLTIPFLFFGLLCFFSLLDYQYVILFKDKIEIKSFFRKRVIFKKDIIGYGIEAYEGEHTSGDRIRIISTKQNLKFHTTQFESIHEIQNFVKGKKILKNAFFRDRIINGLAICLCIGILISPILFEGYFTPKINKDKITSLGIPVRFNPGMKIINEENDQITFTLNNYVNYLFIVDKKMVPSNMKTTDKELIVFIDNPANANELSGKRKHISDTANPKKIPVSRISILE